ncbi:uncharacterized protein [Miscanthus floridulus]|uniref:uncharacterized protein isoform X2 n=2 Tax=Miscanthus floridulus TaxID=154761 RepID=UPI0034583F13
MASVVPPDGLTQNSSLASWYNHVSSSNQYQYFTPSTNSNVDQSFSMDFSRKYEEVRPANESDTHLEKLPMQHFEQQIASGYSSSEDDQRESFAEDYPGDESDAVPENQSFEHQIAGEYSSCEDDTCPSFHRIHGDKLVADLEEDNNNRYYGNKSDTVCLNQPIQHNELDVVVGYSSAEDGPCKPIARWGTTSPLAHNERIMGAVEEAMRKSNDGTKEHMFLPKVGAVFPSLGDAYQFYNLYSWEVGFSIRKGTNQNGNKKADGTKDRNMQ